MPLRKQGTIIPATALALAAAFSVGTASANAASWSSYLAPKTTTAVTTTTTAATTAATAATTTATTAVAAATAPVATTPVATTPPDSCTTLPTTQAFAKYKDTADYSLAPGGSFEAGGPAWTLTTGAKIVSGNENLGVTSGSRALELPVGGTATSPEFCVDETNPYFRFASKLSSLDGGYIAIVLYRDAAGKLTQAQFTASGAGTYFNAATAWNPSAVSPLATKIPLVKAGVTATVQLLFVGTTKSYGQWVGAKATIDSVMVDPYRRG